MKTTDLIKDKLNILDVVSSYVKLEKAGKTYKGKSPFTNEKTPSFFVSPEKGFFYCFSSAKGGDIFTFIQEIERVDFKDALKILAERAGIDLKNYAFEDGDQQKQQYRILDDASKWYEVHLRKNKEVVEYLTGRGLTKDTITQFRLGFALAEWRDIYRYLQSRKYSDADIESVGLIIKKDGSGYYDRFRSRIIFPLFDTQGRIIGFTGRIFGNEDTKGAKYVNSPESELFDKSAVLYGYHTAKTAMARAGNCILVEGQFDVLLAQQTGYTNTVAISGTGLTDRHVGMIKRFTDTILLALDSDSAGIKATRRSVVTAYKHGMRVKVIAMPDGMDPADTILHSRDHWDVCVKDAKEYIDYRLEIMGKQSLEFSEKHHLVTSDLFPFVHHTKSAVVQDRILQKLALFLGVSIESVREDFASASFESEDRIDTARDREVSNNNTNTVQGLTPQEEILLMYLFCKEKGYVQQFTNLHEIQDVYESTFTSKIDDDIGNIDEMTRNIQLFVLEDRYKHTPESSFEKIVHTAIVEERIRSLDRETEALLAKIRQAELNGQTNELSELSAQQQTLLLEKNKLMDSIHT
ncbi:DNA primase [Patescibacteria group bacterium]|nr:DNA primase [Patescibacteria group bacterium]